MNAPIPIRVAGLAALSLVACSQPAREGNAPMEVAEHIISLERSALDRWIRVEGRFAVLTFNLVNYGKPSGSAEETVLVRWNATEIYREIDGVWRIVHTHWSLPQPRLEGSGPE